MKKEEKSCWGKRGEFCGNSFAADKKPCAVRRLFAVSAIPSPAAVFVDLHGRLDRQKPAGRELGDHE
jgi:hypothetical protein